ncbi:MAG: recombination regulator RecX [Betaproteobacteria bacterium]|nr:MAG: recombination regulator RecX [Betaproteobacteria bacterium]
MPEALRTKAIRLLARRERSRAEIQRLLDPHGKDAPRVAALLDELQSEGWLSEARLAEHMINARRARGSAARVRQEMAQRGLSAEVIAEATAGLEEGDVQAALALWRKRFGRVAVERVERERQLRFLLNRGFSQAVALRVLRMAGASDSTNLEE